MQPEIINRELALDIYGFSGAAVNKDYAAKAFQLSGQMWNTVKSLGLKNRGRNIWIYENNDRVFAGVELEEAPPADSGLERKTVTLLRYGYIKHTGPYSLIRNAGDNLRGFIKQKGLTSALPYIEIYGHWVSDDSQPETELITAIG